MRITVLADPISMNSEYRMYIPMRELQRRGHAVRLNDFEPGTLLRADVVYIHRYSGAEMLRVARELKAEGVPIVWDDDDDLVVSRENMRRGGLKQQDAIKRRVQMLRLADIVTTPSVVLAERFRAEGAADVRIVENYAENEFPGTGRPAHDAVVVGWVAGREHMRDLEALPLREALQRLLDTHDHVRVASIGVHLGLKSDRYDHTLVVDFPLLAKELAAFDVGLAPIADNPFNAARSNVKLKEYASVGTPWLASPVGPYVGHGERQGGRLVPDERWEEELERLVTDARLRRKLAKRASRWGRGETIAKNIQKWEAVFREARERAGVRVAA